MIRRATEADIGWMVDKSERRNRWLGIGPFDREHAANLARASRCFVDGEALLWGAEIPAVGSPEPAVNMVFYWDGPAMGLLAEHEAQSDLPSGIMVPYHTERREALMRALKMRGYRPFETLMVK